MKRLYWTIAVLGVCLIGKAQDEGFIYGKVFTSDGRSYEGPLRWGKEEVYWIDVFNGSKDGNENLRHLTHEQRDRLDDQLHWSRRHYGSSSNWRWISWNDDDSNEFTHQFSCQFGEMKSIRRVGRNLVEVELQGGLKVDVKGEGYNDIGSEIKVLDQEIGEMQIDWRDIDKIEFKATPAKLSQKFGQPLYGTVEAYSKSFTGYIQWDHDERLSTDRLDGDAEDGKVHILFEKIKTLERSMNHTNATLKSGRQLDLRGSNDVNSENRGIIITTESGAIVDVPWEEFKRVNFTDAPSKPLKRYDDFKTQKEISATVTTADGKSISGKIILDLDEAYDFELYQGKEADVEFAIPLRNVKKITIKTRDKVMVDLKNGESLSLAESQDVGELNQGVLVFGGKDEPKYIAWEDVSTILFN
ncbi:MAG TPA: hypothetical protein VG737_11770 [Cyclobacteriaceae bacterium]|nr:hypothetical protein [Cyclobacteriaceae bacterium]